MQSLTTEAARLNALRSLKLLDTPPSESFDRITRMAGRLLGAPVAAVSLSDSDRQWFKSRVGVQVPQMPREGAPCDYAIRGEGVFVVPDLLQDPRFAGHPLLETGARFYAGAPLVTRSGYVLGTLCVVDTRPRTLHEDEQAVLADLASLVMTQVELQNGIGRVHPASGHANEYQLLDDLESLALLAPSKPRVALLVELVASGQVNQGMRVLGAHYLETLMRSAVEAIRRSLGGESRLYHIGTIRCAVLLDDVAARDWEQTTCELDRKLRAPIDCGGIPVRPDPAIGVYEFRSGEVKPRDVLRRLYNAMDDARGSGSVVAAYDERHDQAHARRFQLLSTLTDALQSPGQLSLVYQPRVNIASGACVGAEALLRWRHPVFGDVPPGEFIPLVERTEHIRQVTRWVLDRALAQAAAWRAAGHRHKVSVNVSALNLEEEDFAAHLALLLARHGVPAEAIELEFTESALARDGTRVARQLAELQASGIEIAIDDFGTGYSSLAYMQKLPADVVKIDQAFVHKLETSERDQKLVRAMIAMAHDLGYRVVAEGVETAQACALLASWNCDEAQGYHFARPLPAEEWLGIR